MIFKRRERPGVFSRMREFVYPRKGFWRGFDYIGKRVRRLPDTPHRIALGFACGAYVSFTPFFTLHFLLAALLAWVLRGNIVGGLLGTIVGNPISFPAIASASLWAGRELLGHEGEGADFDAVMGAFGGVAQSVWDHIVSWFGGPPSDLSGITVFLDEVFLPYLVGGGLIGLPAAVASYWVVGPLIAAYQIRRQRRFDERAAERRRAIDEELAAYSARDRGEGDNV